MRTSFKTNSGPAGAADPIEDDAACTDDRELPQGAYEGEEPAIGGLLP
jgi:hypothetical protein